MGWKSVMLLLLYYVCILQSDNNFEKPGDPQWFDIILNTINFFHCGCVYIIDANTIVGNLNTTRSFKFLKELTDKHVTTTILEYRQLNTLKKIPHCRRNRPLTVILPDKNQRTHFHQTESSIISSSIWLMFIDKNNEIPVQEVFQEATIPISSEFLIVQQSGTNVFILKEVYHVDPSLPLQVQYFGKWTSSHGMIWHSRSLYQRRSNLENLVMNVGINVDDFFILRNRNETEGSQITGFAMEIWKTLERRLNFKTKTSIILHNSWGVLLDNSTWTGMVGMVHRNEVDVGIGAFSMTSSRSDVVNFFVPLLNVKSSIYFRTPDGEGVLLDNVFIKPFRLRVWIILLMGMGLLAIGLSITYNIGSKIGNEEKYISHFFTLFGSLFYVFASFCQQGNKIAPRSTSCRLVYFTCYATSVTVITFYSAALVSHLTVKQSSVPVTSLREMLQAGTYKLEVGKNSFELDYFNRSENPIMAQVYKKHLEPNIQELPESTLEGLQKICENNGYAYMDYAEPYLKHLNCSVTEMATDGFPFSMTMIISKRSPFLGLINYHLEEMRRSGLLKKLYGQDFPKISADDVTWTATSLEGIAPIIILLASGICFSWLCLITERKSRTGFNKRRTSKKCKTSLGRLPFSN